VIKEKVKIGKTTKRRPIAGFLRNLNGKERKRASICRPSIKGDILLGGQKSWVSRRGNLLPDWRKKPDQAGGPQPEHGKGGILNGD